MFFNEFHLLDLKLEEELGNVDRFIVVESDKTHSNKPKKLLLEGNKKYDQDKLGIKTLEGKFVASAKKNEALQRDVALNPRRVADDDVIICCDVDEIIHSGDFKRIEEEVRKTGYVHLKMKMYYYKLNLFRGWWSHPFAVTGKYWKNSNKTLTQLRHDVKGVPSMKTRGRHFSYLLTPEDISLKIKSFLHTNFNKSDFTNVKNIKDRINKREDLFGRKQTLKRVEIDESYPKSILDNLEKWKYLIEH